MSLAPVIRITRDGKVEKGLQFADWDYGPSDRCLECDKKIGEGEAFCQEHDKQGDASE